MYEAVKKGSYIGLDGGLLWGLTRGLDGFTTGLDCALAAENKPPLHHPVKRNLHYKS